MTQLFRSLMIDDRPKSLADSYRLRYQVYCLERGFLAPERYPLGRETDEFDPVSLHLGAIDLNDDLVGTARLVQPTQIGMPLFKACTIFPEFKAQLRAVPSLAEVSRLCVSRRYRRRHGDGYYGAKERRHNVHLHWDHDDESHYGHHHPQVVVSLYKAIYQTSRRNGITHLLAATEKSLQRLMLRYKFPFHAIGPEVDYFGPVTPYILDLDELDHKLAEHHVPILDDFLDGLEKEFWPKFDLALP